MGEGLAEGDPAHDRVELVEGPGPAQGAGEFPGGRYGLVPDQDFELAEAAVVVAGEGGDAGVEVAEAVFVGVAGPLDLEEAELAEGVAEVGQGVGWPTSAADSAQSRAE